MKMHSKVIAMAALVTAVGMTSAADAKCNGPTREKIGPNGRVVTLCLDGTKATCIRDGMRQGHSREAAAAYCSTRGLR